MRGQRENLLSVFLAGEEKVSASALELELHTSAAWEQGCRSVLHKHPHPNMQPQKHRMYAQWCPWYGWERIQRLCRKITEILKQDKPDGANILSQKNPMFLYQSIISDYYWNK